MKDIEYNNFPLIIGHRGASAHAPENTLAAFQLAIDVGADGIEFDVQLAKDGVPVVIHDATLARTGLRNERIADLTAAELGEIDVGSWFNAKYPKRALSAFSSETVPTLAQVLDLCRDLGGPIYIELKVNVPDYAALVAAVSDVIRHSPLQPKMVVKSFKLAAISEIRRLVPAVKTAALFEPSMMTMLRRRSRLVALALNAGAHQISVHHSLATPKLAALAAEAEMPVTVWTADDPKWIARCRQRCIGSLITNDPRTLVGARDFDP